MKDKTILRVVYSLLILFSLHFLFLALQVPYSLFFTDYKNNSTFAKNISAIKAQANEIKKEETIGFVSDLEREKIFDDPVAIMNFYTAQYAVVPAILKNDTNRKYVIGIFENDTFLSPEFSNFIKLNNKIYIFKRNIKEE